MPVLKVKKNDEWIVVDGMLPILYDADTLDGMHSEEFVHTDGGVLNGTLTLNGIVLTEGVDYGTSEPYGGVVGQLYFKKVT